LNPPNILLIILKIISIIANMRKPLTTEQKIKYSKYKKKWCKIHKKELKRKKIAYCERTKEECKKRDKAYYEKNKNRIIKRNQTYYKNNKGKPLSEKLKKNRRKRRNLYYHKNKSNPVFILRIKIGNLIRHGFNKINNKKKGKSEDILGCSINEFKIHLESQFQPWMNWNNRGLYNGSLNFGWDIDHIIPISSAVTVEDIIRLNHYTNLQPLCSKVNRDIKKGNFLLP